MNIEKAKQFENLRKHILELLCPINSEIEFNDNKSIMFRPNERLSVNILRDILLVNYMHFLGNEKEINKNDIENSVKDIFNNHIR